MPRGGLCTARYRKLIAETMQPLLAAITPGAAKPKSARAMPDKCRATPEREARNRGRRCRTSRHALRTSRVAKSNCTQTKVYTILWPSRKREWNTTEERPTALCASHKPNLRELQGGENATTRYVQQFKIFTEVVEGNILTAHVTQRCKELDILRHSEGELIPSRVAQHKAVAVLPFLGKPRIFGKHRGKFRILARQGTGTADPPKSGQRSLIRKSALELSP
ncbi:hypothetical protein MRX96_029254 [Rhipicephalus microplus]